MLDGGGEERTADERVEDPRLGLAIDGGVGEVPHRRALLRVVAEHLEV